MDTALYVMILLLLLYYLREESSLLREILEPVWSYIIDVCGSSSARDYNACFNLFSV